MLISILSVELECPVPPLVARAVVKFWSLQSFYPPLSEVFLPVVVGD